MNQKRQRNTKEKEELKAGVSFCVLWSCTLAAERFRVWGYTSQRHWMLSRLISTGQMILQSRRKKETHTHTHILLEEDQSLLLKQHIPRSVRVISLPVFQNAFPFCEATLEDHYEPLLLSSGTHRLGGPLAGGTHMDHRLEDSGPQPGTVPQT